MASNKQTIAAAKRIWQQYQERISALLGIPLTREPRFVVGDISGAAETDAAAGIITLSEDWSPDDPGAIVHEAVHFMQNISGGDVSDKYVEAMADAVRARLGQRNPNLIPPGWKPNSLAARLMTLRPWQMRAISTSMQQPDFDETLLKGIESGEVTKDNFNLGVGGAVASAVGSVTGFSQMVAAALGEGGGGGTDDSQSVEDIISQILGAGADSDKKDERRKIRNLASGFEQYVLGLGMKLTPSLQTLIEKAAQRGYSLDTFNSFFRKTPEYHEAFPGIMNKDGSLKMSEATYLQTKSQFEDLGSALGINVGEGRLAWLFKHDVTPAEFADRGEAIKRLQRDDAYYKAFQRELVQGGVARPGEVTRGEMLKFVLGEGNKAWYDLNQDTITRYTANEAGIAVGRARYASLPQKLIEKISGKGLSEEAMSQGFANIAEHLLTTLPLSKVQNYRLSKADIAAAQFGGRQAAEARQKIQRIMDQEEAFYQQRVGLDTFATEGGVVTVGGSGSRAES
jgi:hypothetical protein